MAAIIKLKSNKSPGKDRVFAETLTVLEYRGAKLLLRRICQILGLSIGRIHKQCSEDIFDNYRTITTTSPASNVILQIISE